MSAANQQSGRHGVRRAVVTGVVVVLAVLAAGLVLLALQPRTTTATATLTVTPRTEAGADAALLLADRYTALAGQAEVLDAARADEPALAEVSLTELQEGVRAERPPGTATVVVQVTLPDRDSAVTAANAVVGRLVEAGADEELVAVDPGREASPARATGSSTAARWLVVTVLLALAAGLCAALASTLLSRGRAAGQATGSTDAEGDAEALDDLPGFHADPPGSPAPVPPRTRRTGATAAPVGSPGAVSRTTASVATLTAAALLVLAAVAVGAPTGRAGDNTVAAPPVDTAPTSTAPTPTAPIPTAPDPTAPDPAVTAPIAPAAETGAGALALRSVPLGADGIAATASFGGVVLEERAVGLTVTYPSVSLTSDGRRALAHVRLPTYNCLTTEPPADPVAAGCVRSITEYADLASPELQVTRDGDRIELAGLFPTYTRPNGSAPSYTGRAYQLAASVAPEGPRRDGTTPATGVVRIGLDSAATAPERGVSRLQHPG